MNDTVLAAALHAVFTDSAHGPDSLEAWLAVAAEARRHLGPRPPVPPSWLPLFTISGGQRTDARYRPATDAVRITSGPLTGITYTDITRAAHAITDTRPATDHAGRTPSWRLRTVPGPHPPHLVIPARSR